MGVSGKKLCIVGYSWLTRALSCWSLCKIALKILCGLGIEEIAKSFLTNKETINKRLLRAKKKLREQGVNWLSETSNYTPEQLDNVLHTLYLLFNEGYYSANPKYPTNKEMCLEAMRLLIMILNSAYNTSKSNALMALFCFHSSRFEARLTKNGEFILYDDQDTSLWNQELIEKGEYYLNLSSGGNRVSTYHIEAAIAFWHTVTNDETTKWTHILALYDQLLEAHYSPVIALNKTYAFAKVHGNLAGYKDAKKLNLTDNHFYFMLLAELTQDTKSKKEYLSKALKLASNISDIQIIEKKLQVTEVFLKNTV